MHLLKFPALLALLAFACFSSSATARTSEDGKVKFPADEPTFTVEFPAKWTYEADKDGNLDCEPGDDSAYKFSILILSDIENRKQLREALPVLAKSMAEGAKLKKFELGDIDTDDNGNGVVFTGIRGDGKTDGIDFVVMVHGFEVKGKYYAIVTAGSKKADKKHEKAYDAITASIEPLE